MENKRAVAIFYFLTDIQHNYSVTTFTVSAVYRGVNHPDTAAFHCVLTCLWVNTLTHILLLNILKAQVWNKHRF